LILEIDAIPGIGGQFFSGQARSFGLGPLLHLLDFDNANLPLNPLLDRPHEYKCDEMTLLVIQLITQALGDGPMLRLHRLKTSRPFDSRSPRVRGLQESIIVRFRSDPDSIQTHAASGKPAQVAYPDSMFEQMFSEGAGD